MDIWNITHDCEICKYIFLFEQFKHFCDFSSFFTLILTMLSLFRSDKFFKLGESSESLF